MKRILFFFVSVVLLASCINDQESLQNIHNRDLVAIKNYIENTQINGVKTEQDNQSGVVIIWTELSGSDQSPVANESVKANYTGSYLDGVVFDTSVDSVARENNMFNPNRTYEPLEFRVGATPKQVIAGFDYGLLQMNVGDIAVVLIPSQSAYGSTPPQGIRKDAVLRFDVELVEILGR